MSKRVKVTIKSEEMSADELTYIKESLEAVEGWQLTGNGEDDFYFVVETESKGV